MPAALPVFGLLKSQQLEMAGAVLLFCYVVFGLIAIGIGSCFALAAVIQYSRNKNRQYAFPIFSIVSYGVAIIACVGESLVFFYGANEVKTAIVVWRPVAALAALVVLLIGIFLARLCYARHGAEIPP